MSTRLETASSMPDVVKWIAAAVRMGAGLVGFYYFSEQSTLLRIIGLLLAIAAAVFVSVQTEKGRAVGDFMRESRTEVRKVVWPTRKETTTTTAIVMGVVFVVGLILWLLDTIFGKLVQILLAQGG